MCLFFIWPCSLCCEIDLGPSGWFCSRKYLFLIVLQLFTRRIRSCDVMSDLHWGQSVYFGSRKIWVLFRQYAWLSHVEWGALNFILTLVIGCWKDRAWRGVLTLVVFCFKKSLVKTKQVSSWIFRCLLMRVSQNRSVHLIGCCDQRSNLLM